MADKQLRFGIFADDEASAKFDRVGNAAESAGGKMRTADTASREAGSGFDRAGEGADGAERHLIGLHDVVDGTAAIMQGPGKAGITAYIQGWADLAGGVAPLLPSLNALRLSSLRNTAAQVAGRTASIAAAAAERAQAAATWVLNAALRANPIGIVITALTLLVAGFVLAYRRSETFRAIVQTAFRGVLAVGRALGSGLGAVFRGIGTAASAVGNAIAAPFRLAFSGIRAAWNSTIGGKGFTVPSWVPGIGGKGFTIPYLARGGVVTGPTLAVLGEAGREAVIPLDRAGDMLGGGQPIIVQLHIDGRKVQESLLNVKRGNGGAALGLA